MLSLSGSVDMPIRLGTFTFNTTTQLPGNACMNLQVETLIVIVGVSTCNCQSINILGIPEVIAEVQMVFCHGA